MANRKIREWITMERLTDITTALRDGDIPKDISAQIINGLRNVAQDPAVTKETSKSMFDRIWPLKQDNDDIQLTKEIRELVLTTFDNFLTTDVYKILGLTTRDNKKKCCVVLGRLKEEGLIAPYGKRGSYRVVKKTWRKIDWKNAGDIDPLPILWPLALEQKFNTLRGGFVVVAGAKSAGKTAMLLSLCLYNEHLFKGEKVYYWASSQESGEHNLKLRLSDFRLPEEAWDHVEFGQPDGSMADVIQPNALNLIDYLEVGNDEEFYRAGAQLTDIFKQLKNGIAIVAMQKNEDQSLARGGAATLDRTTAYLTMNPANQEHAGTLIIKDAKYPVERTGCNGFPIPYRIEFTDDGVKFVKAYQLGIGKKQNTWTPF